MRVAMIGTGYVGLVSGACFADFGHTVTCVDKDASKIERLHQNIMPIYEPALDDLVASNVRDGRLAFAVDGAEAIRTADAVFIAVGTPSRRGDGHADLSYVYAAAEEIADLMDGFTVVVTKSTVPVGTGDEIERIIRQRRPDADFAVVSNPEFLREGAAIGDFKRPDRVVVGTNDERARAVMAELYRPLNLNETPIMFTGRRTSELIKYAANAFLAMKITFINEVADLCEAVGADVQQVARGIGLDNRIGSKFLHAGPGYGGSCFPKDVKALINIAHQNDFEPKLLQAVESRNDQQKHSLFNKISTHFDGDLSGRTFAVWGLAFKPGTDDMREAPSVVLINSLINAGAKVRAFDPVARETARREFPESWFNEGRLQIVEGQYEAAIDADALCLVTEWKPFRRPDFRALKRLLNTPLIIDGRNQYDREQVKREGFSYYGIGRQPVQA
ncbi:MAG TPA: UDP-glucose 6-dehydrogenase [Pseudomonas sp.]|nr:UDP-glucose 6-dehydrogenase [Pseudomonas sp.]